MLWCIKWVIKHWGNEWLLSDIMSDQVMLWYIKWVIKHWCNQWLSIDVISD